MKDSLIFHIKLVQSILKKIIPHYLNEAVSNSTLNTIPTFDLTMITNPNYLHIPHRLFYLLPSRQFVQRACLIQLFTHLNKLLLELYVVYFINSIFWMMKIVVINFLLPKLKS